MPLPPWAVAAIPAAGDVLGGLFGRSGQHSANQANLQIARENREWQQMMSNTAYQRATKDLESAGLNRILALGSPSSTPAGNVATMQNEQAPLAEGVHKGVHSALQAKMMQAQINFIKAQTQAIQPAATAGEGLQEIIINAKKRLSPKTIDYENLINEIPENIMRRAKEQGGKWTQVWNKFTELAGSVNLNPTKAQQLLIQTIDQMDLPPMTDQQKIAWAMQNPEKIKEFLNRKKTKGF